MRLGHGIDFHRFAEGRTLRLGGVEIPAEQGLLGHSDADVLLHALCDALLGAMALGDIGMHFPDNEEAFHNIDSSELLKQVLSMMDENYRISNVDITLIGEKPRLSAHREKIRTRLSELLSLSHKRINVKATTTEKMGDLGRGEGLGCFCTVLLEEEDELL